VAIDGKPIENGEQLRSALPQYQVGDTATLTIVRDGKRQAVKVTLSEAQ
jgi:S1-C subfamily serine protease